ncbi:hypothetical protein CASFOL_009029 [Castilleja foliolosa]|uniref:Uncharacterized protein n=1 Tax=Castilleja foliolosa TaxID=1961234 RepID=A0ABD3E1R8_9LAMI
MSSLARLLLTLSLAFIISATSPPSTAANPLTVYEALESYGFPPGLVPTGATGYELDPATGKFSAHLNSSCSFTIDGYDLKYKDTITGTISTDKIKDLTGIQVKVLLFWVNIIEVSKEGDQLELSVGIASADFPADNFYESPECGCGFDCVNSEKRNGKFSFKNNIPLAEV